MCKTYKEHTMEDNLNPIDEERRRRGEEFMTITGASDLAVRIGALLESERKAWDYAHRIEHRTGGKMLTADAVMSDVELALEAARQAHQRLDRVVVEAIREMVPKQVPETTVEAILAELIARYRALQGGSRYVSGLAIFDPTAELAAYAMQHGKWSEAGHGTVDFKYDQVHITLHGMRADGTVMTAAEWYAMYDRQRDAAVAVATHQANAHDYSGCPEDDLVTAQAAAPNPQGETMPDPETFATPADAGWKA